MMYNGDGGIISSSGFSIFYVSGVILWVAHNIYLGSGVHWNFIDFWNETFIEFSESDKSLNYELGSF